MFELRLKIILGLAAGCMVALSLRLFLIQVIEADQFKREAEAALVAPREWLPPLRGRIVDRYDRVLVADEPAHDAAVHYGVISGDANYLAWVARDMRIREPVWKSADDESVRAEVLRRVERAWSVLAEQAGQQNLEERRKSILRSVERLREHIAKARRARGDVAGARHVRLEEETIFHPVIRDLSPAQRTRIELDLSGMPFVRVEPSVRRVWDERAAPLCHLLGQMRQVSPEEIKSDALAADPLARYRAGDEVGGSGVEQLGESRLRGSRGMVERDRDGVVLALQRPQDGGDLALTIDLDLQTAVAEMLTETVAKHPPSTGASCVVLDTVTREILALVSVPYYDRQAYATGYAALRDDARRTPLTFRAVREEYQPGSILKPAALLAGFAGGLIDPNTTVHCDGSFVDDSDKWHCWTHWSKLPGHGDMNAEAAIQHSCNIYFYDLGQRLGAGRLTEFYRLILHGIGPEGGVYHGAGLAEERAGLIPTADVIRRRFGRGYRIGDGRNYAIGQGELMITPLVAANLFATLASGFYRDPVLMSGDEENRAQIELPGISPLDWDLIRNGLDHCVNDPAGTAYKYVHMNELRICGKTGSAQCVPRIVQRKYVFRTEDPLKPVVSTIAATEEAARAELGLSAATVRISREVIETWPPPDAETGKIPTHSWFAGFAPYENPRIALAVIIEYGGGGGHTAGPVARQIFEFLHESPRGYLNPPAHSE